MRFGALTPDAFAMAAVPLLGFSALYMVLLGWLPPSVDNRSAADPLVQVLPFAAPGIGLLCALVGAGWLVQARARRAVIVAGLGWTLAGAVAGLVGVGLVYLLVGDTLPAFVPREESAAPGMALGLGAGVLEEALFRLGVLPAVFLPLARRLGGVPAAGVACVVTGLLFALSHELGPGAAEVFALPPLLARVLIPGVVMSALALWIHPAFLVALHCSAHIPIALLFVA